jgi:hypothetical protein
MSRPAPRRSSRDVALHHAARYVFRRRIRRDNDLLGWYARSPRGMRISDHTPCSRWQTHAVVAALRSTELTPTQTIRRSSRTRLRIASSAETDTDGVR